MLRMPSATKAREAGKCAARSFVADGSRQPNVHRLFRRPRHRFCGIRQTGRKPGGRSFFVKGSLRRQHARAHREGREKTFQHDGAGVRWQPTVQSPRRPWPPRGRERGARSLRDGEGGAPQRSDRHCFSSAPRSPSIQIAAHIKKCGTGIIFCSIGGTRMRNGSGRGARCPIRSHTHVGPALSLHMAGAQDLRCGTGRREGVRRKGGFGFRRPGDCGPSVVRRTRMDHEFHFRDVGENKMVIGGRGKCSQVFELVVPRPVFLVVPWLRGFLGSSGKCCSTLSFLREL